MSELRKDPTRGEWVLVRPRGAADLAGSECLFCPGNEARTPPEIAAYRKEGSAPNSPGWQVRVVPDVDPCFRVEWDLVREGVGMYDRISPRGAAELIIESPSHDDTPATMGADQIERVLWMYRAPAGRVGHDQGRLPLALRGGGEPRGGQPARRDLHQRCSARGSLAPAP